MELVLKSIKVRSIQSYICVSDFPDAGHVPSLKEGNLEETIFNPPWRHQPVAIGLQL